MKSAARSWSFKFVELRYSILNIYFYLWINIYTKIKYNRIEKVEIITPTTWSRQQLGTAEDINSIVNGKQEKPRAKFPAKATERVD